MVTIQLKRSYVDEGVVHFVLPLIFFGISFYLLPWYVNLSLVVVLLSLVKSEYLLALYAGFTFYNIMNQEDIPFWGSLVTSFLAIFIVLGRVGVIKRRVSANLLIPAVLIVFVVTSFVFKTLGEYYLMTGLKSSIQILFLLTAIIILSCIPDRYKASSKRVFDKFFPVYFFLYLLTALIFHDYKDRFGASTDPQCLGLQLTLLLCYFCDAQPPKRAFQFFLLMIIFFTGSRTYFLTGSLFLAYDYFKKSSTRIKLLVLANALVISVLLLVVLPFTGSRLDYTAPQFLGTLFGRFKYYKNAFDLILEHPILGNGMGSILRVLENWVSRRGFQFYKLNGDTTIVHNEYLRILIELGLLGFGLVIFGIRQFWKRLRNTSAKYILLVFLIGSMVENNLTLYTTGTLLFVMLMTFSNVPRENNLNTE